MPLNKMNYLALMQFTHSLVIVQFLSLAIEIIICLPINLWYYVKYVNSEVPRKSINIESFLDIY